MLKFSMAFYVLVGLLILQGCGVLKNSSTNQVVKLEEGIIKGKFNLVELDRLDQIYLQTDGNLLAKINLKTGVKVEYFDNRQGAIDELDVYDPLNIVAFYRPYGIVKILDNTLNVIKTINLQNSTPYANVKNVATSNDGGLWIYDDIRQRIVKLDDNLNTKIQSNNLSDLGLQNVQIKLLKEYKNKLYVLIHDGSILVFDNFGQFQKKIKALSSSSFTFVGDRICQLFDGSLHCYDDFQKSFVTDRSSSMTGIKRLIVSPTHSVEVGDDFVLIK
jgi:hypothetical protein